MAFHKPPTFNFDILSEVVNQAPQDVQLALASTCRNLRTLSWRAFQHPVILGSNSALESFIQFTRGLKKSGREHLLGNIWSLTMSWKELKDHRDLAEESRVILCNTTGIRELTLIDGEEVLHVFPQLGDAVADLREVNVIEIHGAGQNMHQVIGSMKSRPRRLLSIANTSWEPLFVHWHLPPNWTSRLERLDVSHLDTRPNPEAITDFTTFPLVRHLSVKDVITERGRYHLMECFPNLDTLDVGVFTMNEMINFPWMDLVWSLPPFREERLSNKTVSQAAIRRVAERGGSGLWRDLKLVRGGVWDLFCSGHICRTEVLEVLGLVRKSPLCLDQIVGDHSPQCLRVTLSAPLQRLKSCTEKRFRSVKSLYLRLDLEDGRVFNVGQFIAGLTSFVKRFTSCENLLVHIMSTSEERHVLDLLQELCDKKVLDIARAVVDSAPKLGFVGVRCTWPDYRDSYTFWRVETLPEDTTIRNLGSTIEFEDGEEFLQKHKMLSEVYDL